MEEQTFRIAGRQERIAVAPCMLLSPTAERAQSWLETVAVALHRKIVHEFVLRQLLVQRYGAFFDFRNVGELLRGLPVFYRHRSDRYYLLRDVVRLLPRVRRVAGISYRRPPKRSPSATQAEVLRAEFYDRETIREHSLLLIPPYHISK
jgi:hypothetical protein